MSIINEDLADFPAVDDFTITLVETDASGQQIEYTSASRGRLAGFPAWEHVDRDLRHFIAEDVPLGTIDEPYDDRDEGWRIVIFQNDGWVYVAEGDHPRAAEFPRKFRVRTDHYVRVWAAIIDEFNPVAPLDPTAAADPTIQ
jgi:hypothetical protein